ncbi:MAG: aspartate/glutamate racemase family protein, partial [Candidatus Lokiarchaeota archaeon]|nr:aspartate/glutamate racemase family protein [Candidatus Lokiarchaeota archaeon]
MTSLVKGGKNTYGEIIGIIMQERKFPRIPGDIGNAWTFSFPVKYHVIKGLNISTRRKLWSSDYEEFINLFVTAAKQLEKDGVRAITSS